jgi:putative hydrolase of the HAD superfamily
MTSALQVVIFDYGNVLCPMPQPQDFEKLAHTAGIPSTLFLQSLWRNRLDYDRGTLDGPAYWRQVAKENGKEFSEAQIRRLIEIDLGLWTRLDDMMLAWARALRKSGLKTSILSNMPRDFSSYLRSNATWLSDFDYNVFSGELGVVKPDAGIYLACLQGLNSPPDQTLFIDDMAANVDGARALGMKAIKFDSVAQLAVAVEPFGLPPPVA